MDDNGKAMDGILTGIEKADAKFKERLVAHVTAKTLEEAAEFSLEESDFGEAIDIDQPSR